MFNESFSIRALLARPMQRSPQPTGAASAVSPTERDGETGAAANLPDPHAGGFWADWPGGGVPAVPAVPMMLAVPVDRLAFAACVPTPLPPAPTRVRRPTRVAEMLAGIHGLRAGTVMSFSQLKDMLPRNAKTHSAIEKMLEYGFLVRLDRGLYERTATLLHGEGQQRDPRAFIGLNLSIVRNS